MAAQAEPHGVTYPYIFPESKEIDDKIPTVNIDTLTGPDGGPYPASSAGPIHTFTNTTTMVKGRHTFKAGVVFEYSGEDDFDQINVSAIPGGTNNQNGQFAFRNSATARSGLGMADMALGLFTDYAELGQRAFTKWRSLATDIFIQDSWKPAANLTIEGGLRYVMWPPWYSTTNNIANFDPRFYSTRRRRAIINVDRAAHRWRRATTASSWRVTDSSGRATTSSSRRSSRPGALPRRAAWLLEDALQRVRAAHRRCPTRSTRRPSCVRSVGVFHNRVLLNDSTLLGGNPPLQPMVPLSQRQRRQPWRRQFTAGATCPSASRRRTLSSNIRHPTCGRAASSAKSPLGFLLDVTYVGRRGLYLPRERNINQLQPGTLAANPGVRIEALRPYKGYGIIRLSENAGRSMYNSLQISADRRYSNGFKFGLAYTLGKSTDNASDKRNILWDPYDDTNYEGPSNFDRRHVLSFYYIYDLPFWREPTNLVQNILGGWQISGATFMRTGTPFTITRTDDRAGTGDGSIGQPIDMIGDPFAGTNGKFSSGSDDNFYFNPAAFAQVPVGALRFGNMPRNAIYGPGDQQWDIALFKNVRVTGTHKVQLRVEVFNFLNHPNLSGPVTDITNANFGRIITKSGDRRDIQLAVRYLF